jgi:hypothetical protein
VLGSWIGGTTTDSGLVVVKVHGLVVSSVRVDFDWGTTTTARDLGAGVVFVVVGALVTIGTCVVAFVCGLLCTAFGA